MIKFKILAVIIFIFQVMFISSNEGKSELRDYYKPENESIRNFYRINHKNQTLNFVLKKKKEYLPPRRLKLEVWQALKLLDKIIDESDPDVDSSQIYHAFQTAQAIQDDGHPEWLILTGLIHDMGKMLCIFGEPQWAVVGDTFPLGCEFSKDIVLSEYFVENPDINYTRISNKIWNLPS